MRVKCYTGVKLMSVKEKLVTKSKRLRLVLKKLISTGDRAEFQFLVSVNILAEFHFKKGQKNPSLSWRNLDWFPVCGGTMHLIPSDKCNGSGSSILERKGYSNDGYSEHCFESQQLITHLILSCLCTECNLLYESYI